MNNWEKNLEYDVIRRVKKSFNFYNKIIKVKIFTIPSLNKNSLSTRLRAKVTYEFNGKTQTSEISVYNGKF